MRRDGMSVILCLVSGVSVICAIAMLVVEHGTMDDTSFASGDVGGSGSGKAAQLLRQAFLNCVDPLTPPSTADVSLVGEGAALARFKESHLWVARICQADDVVPLEARIASLRVLSSAPNSSAAKSGASFRRVATERFRLWEDVVELHKLSASAQEALMEGQVVKCDEDVRRFREIVRGYQGTGDEDAFQPEKLALEAVVRVRELVDKESEPIGVRLAMAQEVFRESGEFAQRDMIRRTVKRWILEGLEGKHVPDISSDIQEVVGRRYGNLILGVFERKSGEGYFYWESPTLRQTGGVPMSISNEQIVAAPRTPFVVSSVEEFNGQCNAVKVSLLDKSQWQKLASLCMRHEEEASRLREIARKFVKDGRIDEQGVWPLKYRDYYLELSFSGQEDFAVQVVENFGVVAELLEGA